MKKGPLRYPGGKSRGVTFLMNYIPAYQTFREVFFGGGSLSFYLLQQNPGKVYEASDLNYELYCFWTQLQQNPLEVIKGVQAIYDEYKSGHHSKENGYGEGKRLFQCLLARREGGLSEIQRAIDFYVLNRITFSGVVDSGGFSQASFEGRFTQSSIDRLNQTTQVIEPIQFYCEDYRYLLDQPGDEVFLFLDPPYYSATRSKLYGKGGILHTQFDHEKMLSCLKESPHKWLITYDNSDHIKELYKDFYQVEWKLQYGMTNKNNTGSRSGNEVLIANYDLEQVARSNGFRHSVEIG